MGNLKDSIGRSWDVLSDLLPDRTEWLLAFSGGKDSTALLVLVTEFLAHRRPEGVRLEILYADTGLEIPPMARHADRMREAVEAWAAAESLPVWFRIVRPPLPERFWPLMLGKGYPAPGFRFRWCTDRLKVRPMVRLAQGLTRDPDKAVMLVGIREGESAERNRRLRNSCGRGECGPAAVGRASIFPVVAPILHWKSCEIWDFLSFEAPQWGWPTEGLWRLYGEDEAVRYGCWLCPLVRKDRAMQAALAAADGERPILEALAAFRERLLEVSRAPENRTLRPDGRWGRLRQEIRQQLLLELLDLQERTGLTLLSPDEHALIISMWEEEP